MIYSCCGFVISIIFSTAPCYLVFLDEEASQDLYLSPNCVTETSFPMASHPISERRWSQNNTNFFIYLPCFEMSTFFYCQWQNHRRSQLSQLSQFRKGREGMEKCIFQNLGELLFFNFSMEIPNKDFSQ